MRDPLAGVLAALVGALPPDCRDATLLADVLWLAASAGPPPEGDTTATTSRDGTAAGAPPDPGPPPAEEPPPRPAGPDEGDPDGEDPDECHGAPRRRPYGLHENLPGGPEGSSAVPVTVAAGRALPQAVELGRSLRPFMRRFPHGRRLGLDLAATIDSYTRDGELLPVVAPLPEPWFDVLLVVDTHPSMEVWQDTVQEFASLLENSGAFRQVHRWHLSTEPHPDVSDARGHVMNSRNVAAPDGRRLVLVVSDCAAPSWYGNEVWQLLRDWACHTSVSVANPLPARLWHRTALDLPAVRVRSRLPGTRNTALAVTVPPHLRAVLQEGTPYVAVPTLSLTAHSLNRWAQGLARGAPDGYEAVLVTPFGAPSDPFDEDRHAEAGPAGEAGGEDSRRGSADPAGVFLRTASPPAVRLAGLCSAFRRLSLPLIQLVRQEVVPEATTSDVAELLMSGVLDITSARGEPQVISFKERARAPLARTAGRHDAWLVLEALSRHIAARVRLSGQGLSAIAALDTEELPESLRPFAYATGELVTALRTGAPPGRAVPDHDDRGAGSGGGSGGESEDARGGGPTRGESPRPFLPDPLHSAALLIGAAPAEGPEGDVDEVVSTLEELSELLTSEEGWDLPAERCELLIDATAEQVRGTLRTMAAMADEALLVWYVGHRNSPGLTPDAWVTGPGGERVSPDELLADLDTAHLVVVEDGCSARRSVRLAEARADRAGVTWLTYENAPAEDPPALTRHVLRHVAEGEPGAPSLLTVTRLVTAAARSAPDGWSLRSTLLERPDGLVPALVRNRASAPRPRRTSPDAQVDRALARVRAELRLAETLAESPLTADATSVAAVERVLDTSLRFLAARVRRPRPDRRPPRGHALGTFGTELSAFFDAHGVTVLPGPDFPLVCRAQQTGTATAVPVEVLNCGHTSRWVRPSADAVLPSPLTFTPFALLLVLDSDRDTRHGTLTERVSVTRNSGTGVGVVTLRFPGAPPAPARARTGHEVLADEVREAVNAYCAEACVEAPWSGYSFLSILINGGVSGIPADLTEGQAASVRPDPAGMRLVPRGAAGEVYVSATVELVGLLPTSSIASTPHVTVLSGTGSSGYAFVSVEVRAVLAFDWTSERPLKVEFRRAAPETLMGS